MKANSVVPSSRNATLIAGLAAGAYLIYRARRPAFSFRGKTVAITGGTRGLGLVLARRLISLGAYVSICGRDELTLSRAVSELSQSGNAMGNRCDVRDCAQVRHWVETTEKRLGPVDVMIHNAGVIQVGPYDAMRESDYRLAMDTHFYGALHAVNAVVGQMRARGAGRIALIASLGGKRGVPHMVPYDASKFAMVGLGEGLSIELAKYGISVTTVCPGLMRTGSPRNASFKGDHRNEYAWFSVSDSLPGMTVSAETAAAKILDAIRNGRSELMFPLSAKIGARLASLFPGVYVNAMRLVDKKLPTNANRRTKLGRECSSKVSPSWVTSLSDRAAERNNEMGPFSTSRPLKA